MSSIIMALMSMGPLDPRRRKPTSASTLMRPSPPLPRPLEEPGVGAAEAKMPKARGMREARAKERMMDSE